ncbi:hypothetical protein KL915_003804 [Ogataea haglerorum]|uniref:Pterin-binding domain-containing protein n=1 Tax=Ogataea haglerorum TaxID=1937702 RepID=A0ABQ7RGZ8_9ASCO|nr:hypothetical protein KL915_003804 [Ogataea haglerorum]KAG7765431.1 hypothetical protein KL946_002488 [Ogataea haglerorum]
MFSALVRSPGLKPFMRRVHTGDTVSIKNLRYCGLINGRRMPLSLSTDLITDFGQASTDDDLRYSINYAVLSRDLRSFEKKYSHNSFRSLLQLGEGIFNEVLFSTNCKRATLTLTMDHPDCDVAVEMSRDKSDRPKITLRLDNLGVDTIIGVFKEERLAKQPVVLNLALDLAGEFSVDSIVSSAKNYVSRSQFKTVEALALNVAKLAFQAAENARHCKVSVLKPKAIDETDGVGVSVARSRADVQRQPLVDSQSSDYVPNLSKTAIVRDGKHTVYLAVGSNQGSQLTNIIIALDELAKRNINVRATSSLFRSAPMYYSNQPDFVNGCVKVETELRPQDLLKQIKEIEYEVLGRVKHFDNGPRPIDLDIILYDEAIYNSADLTIPHISMLERPFVLAPLCQLVPPDMLHPVTAEPIHSHWHQLRKTTRADDLQPVIPISGARMLPYGSRTLLMSILNVTPDSFSDGAASNLEIGHTLSRVERMAAAGVDIVDLGGCSTRPGSEQVSEAEELDRVLPVLEQIRKQFPELVVSVDTYRAEVARASVQLGADIINDVSGGLLDDKMYEFVAQSGVGYVLGHMRGNIATMNALSNYDEVAPGEVKQFSDYSPVMGGVCRELGVAIEKMQEAGVRRWQVIIDPGLGFAKKTEHNLELIRDLKKLAQYRQLSLETGQYVSFDDVALLMGPSRKQFIGGITGKPPKDRVFGTAAAVSACIANGADIVRVHDFEPMKDVALVADSIYRTL